MDESQVYIFYVNKACWSCIIYDMFFFFFHHWNYIKDWHEFWLKFDNVQNQMVQMFVNCFVKEKKKIDIKFIVVY
jgi:hypothetical protein